MGPKSFWLQDHFISWEQSNVIFYSKVARSRNRNLHLNQSLFFLFVCVLFFFSIEKTEAQVFNIQVGDSVTVSSDKGIRRTTGENFEAIGNVVIINKDEAIYGEKASLQMDTGQIDVQGNVRYVGPLMTMHGQQLSYNIHSKFLSMVNGKIVAEGYSVWGEYMAKVGPYKIIAEKAEYTTCLDCPESWTIYGDHINLTLNEYIHIRPALIKSNGAPIFYSPYAVFPIKRGRQTGLLFPNFSFSLTKGINYKQPFFWAISENKDMTLTPSLNDVQGASAEIEYRHFVGESKWFDINTFGAKDLVYLPNDEGRLAQDKTAEPSHSHYYRYLWDYEQHYQFGNYTNHHLVISGLRDKDLMVDHPQMMERRLMGSELPNWGFFNGRTTLFDFNIEGSYNNNLLTNNSLDGMGFDHHYVQTLPRIGIGVVPIPIVQSDVPFFQNINIGLSSVYTRFRQNHIKEKSRADGGYGYARNVERFEVYPSLDWVFGSIGPMTFKTELRHEVQFYHFKQRKSERSFKKSGNIITSEMFFEIDKVFSPAYKESIPVGKVRPKEGKGNTLEVEENKEWRETIGSLPEIGKYYTDDEVMIEQSSYRHSMNFNFRHFLTLDEERSGSYSFGKQIQHSYGLFDEIDKPKDLVDQIGSNESATAISQKNTIEFRLFNSIFKKSAHLSVDPPDGSYLLDNFSYTKLAYLDISQGVEVESNSHRFNERENRFQKRYSSFQDRLTRLFVGTGFPIKNWSLSFTEYYFYQNGGHKATGAVGTTVKGVKIAGSYSYDSVGTHDPNRSWSLALAFYPFSTVAYSGSYSYDLKNNHYLESHHSLIYVPLNNCWKTSIAYSERPTAYKREWDLTFNFYVNFGEGRFVSILTPGGEGQDGAF